MMLKINDELLYSLPVYTRFEVRQNECSNWIIINDLVLDLTEFLHIHPGGQEVLYEYLGLDATSVFEDVGHSSMARTLMLRYVIGRVAVDTGSETKLMSCCGSFSETSPGYIKRRRSSAAANAITAMAAKLNVVTIAGDKKET